MAAKTKTPTLAQVRKLAKEKLGEKTDVVSSPTGFGKHARATRYGTHVNVITAVAPSRSAALRALYAALEAL